MAMLIATSCPVVAWSTAVEFQFYFVSPFLVYFYAKKPAYGYAATTSLILVCLIVRAALVYSCAAYI